MTDDAAMTRPRQDDLTDETLVALADGELTEREAARLRALMAADPELAARFASFAETRALLAPEPAAEARDPGLDRLAAAIHAVDRALITAGQDKPRLAVIEGGGRSVPPAARPPSRFRVAFPAMAAGLALMIGGAIGYRAGLSSPQQSAGGAIVAVANAPGSSAALAAALERSPSGDTVRWRDDGSGLAGSLVVLSSHKISDGRFCREYEAMVAGQDEKAVGVGCRDAGGRWTTELVSRAPSGEGAYGTASGAGVAETALTALGSAGALPDEEEKSLIGQGWTAPK